MEKVYEFDKKEYGKRINKDDKKHNKSNLIYNSNCCFHKYHYNEKFDNLSFKSRYSFLADFLNELDKFSRLKLKKKTQKRKKVCMIQIQSYITSC